jgi:hypothetical protein
MATQIFIISGTSMTIPADFNPSNNTIEALAGGGSGGAVHSVAGNASGGGASPYVALNNFNVAASASVFIQIGAGGAAVSAGTNSTANGNAGTDTWLNKTTNAAPSSTTNGLLAKAGQGGAGNKSGSASGGAAGATASCIGDTIVAGANGGNATLSLGSNPHGGAGGGGAGGPDGAGNAGGNVSGSSSAQSAGGSSDAGMDPGGVGGAAGGTDGGDGTYWSSSPAYGFGGGGGGSDSSTGGDGGTYGAGGGASSSNSTNLSGAGSQGIIVITYTPAVLVVPLSFIAPMIGM